MFVIRIHCHFKFGEISLQVKEEVPSFLFICEGSPNVIKEVIIPKIMTSIKHFNIEINKNEKQMLNTIKMCG